MPVCPPLRLSHAVLEGCSLGVYPTESLVLRVGRRASSSACCSSWKGRLETACSALHTRPCQHQHYQTRRKGEELRSIKVRLWRCLCSTGIRRMPVGCMPWPAAWRSCSPILKRCRLSSSQRLLHRSSSAKAACRLRSPVPFRIGPLASWYGASGGAACDHSTIIVGAWSAHNALGVCWACVSISAWARLCMWPVALLPVVPASLVLHAPGGFLRRSLGAVALSGRLDPVLL